MVLLRVPDVWRLVLFIVGAMIVLCVVPCAAFSQTNDASQQFWKHWGDGNGEIATYATTQSRYGELRTGETVMIFVTEEMSRRTGIKVESEKIPPQDRMPVIKFNRNVKFQTGVYDYSYMTSTFSALSSEMGLHPLSAMKISHAMTEWCGNYFGMVRTEHDGIRFTRHSYFEAEGDTDGERLALPNGAWEYEDNLPILIRELNGEWMNAGETRRVMLLPTFQHQRFLHTPHVFLSAEIKKESSGPLRVGEKNYPSTTTWSWSYDDVKGPVRETYIVDASYPHHILSWKSSDGSSGKLLAVKRLPYWNQHDNASAPLRHELKLMR